MLPAIVGLMLTAVGATVGPAVMNVVGAAVVTVGAAVGPGVTDVVGAAVVTVGAAVGAAVITGIAASTELLPIGPIKPAGPVEAFVGAAEITLNLVVSARPHAALSWVPPGW